MLNGLIRIFFFLTVRKWDLESVLTRSLPIDVGCHTRSGFYVGNASADAQATSQNFRVGFSPKTGLNWSFREVKISLLLGGTSSLWQRLGVADCVYFLDHIAVGAKQKGMFIRVLRFI